MKKEYTAPYAEKINFNYKDQVVASDSVECFFQAPTGYSKLGCTDKTLGEGAMNN